ncbi:MAG: medium chain dehydrogenase/reductase family protein [Clostridia bacterium]|nr:medium chain dehydrogenase/reductase family protein [Clostridia bacterium]
MKILTIVGKNNLEVINSPHEHLQVEPEEAIVKISHVSLCGSDYKLYNGNYSGPSNYPLVFGHEWSGTIVEINSPDSKLKVGDIVTGDCSKWGTDCSFCLDCQRDKNICTRIEKFGITIDGFAQEYVKVPVKHLYAAPANMSLDILALAELFSVALNGIKKSLAAFDNTSKCLHKSSDDSILIIGAGPLGIAVYILLKHMFKKQNVKVYELAKERIDFIKSVYPELEFAELEAAGDSSNYAGLLSTSIYDIIFEVSGSPKALNTSLSLVQAGGTVVLLGMYPNGEIEANKIVLKALSVRGSIGGTGSFEEVISFLNDHQDLVSWMITKKVNVSEMESVDVFEKDAFKSIKTQICFD